MKRSAILLIALCAALALSACGGAKSAPAPTESVQTEVSPPAETDDKGLGIGKPAPETAVQPSATTPLPANAPKPSPYYSVGHPLCLNWIGVGADESYAYSFNISSDGYYHLSYHDLSIADGLGEDTITWRTSGSIEIKEDRLVLLVHNEGDSFTTEYGYRLEPSGLFLTNFGKEQVFSNLEWEAEANGSESIYFWKYTPQIAYIAPAFAICGIYDQQEAYENHFWEILSTAASLYEYEWLAVGDEIPEQLRYDADSIELFATALFGRYYLWKLPDTAGTDVTLDADGSYCFSFREEVCGWSIDLLEHFFNGSMLLSLTENGEDPIYIRYPLDNLYDSEDKTGFDFQIRDILPVYLVDDKEEYTDAFIGTHRYFEFAEPYFTREYTVTVQEAVEPAEYADYDVEMQIQGYQTDETVYGRAFLNDGELQVMYVRAKAMGEPTDLYEHEDYLFTLYFSPDGGVTLRPQALYTFYETPLRETAMP